MATVLTDTPTPPPYKPADLAHVVAQPHADQLTWTIRQQTFRIQRLIFFRKFTNALREVADVWQNHLSEGMKILWTARNALDDGARPYMKKGPANGWNIFSQYLFAASYFDKEPTGVETTYHARYPVDVDLDAANVADQRLYLTATLDDEIYAGNQLCFFVYQINPKFLQTVHRERFTRFAGYSETPVGPGITHSFSVPAPWPFVTGQTVRALLRAHASVQGVDNWPLDVIAA